MEDNKFNPENEGEKRVEPQIHVNEYGDVKDSAVVVEEADRTVLLTENETIIIPKEQMIDVPPKNRARKVYAGMWGTTELVTVGLSLLAILTTLLVFIFLVLPAQRELSNNRDKRDDLEKQLTTAKSRYGNVTTTQEGVQKILLSVDDFETRFLSAQTVGQNALYQQINGLIAAYGLTNTAGPDYVPLAVSDPYRTQQNSDDKGKSKAISIYPGTYITMTVDGSYMNLRRFIREIETSNQFIVITAVQLEPSDNKEKENDPTKPPPSLVSQPQQPGVNQPKTNGFPPGTTTNYEQPYAPEQTSAKADRGKTHGETVTLRLELAAYFRRPNFQPQAASVEQ